MRNYSKKNYQFIYFLIISLLVNCSSTTVVLKPYQKNDYFALIFATPSALGFIFGTLYNSSVLIAFGLGILLYGLAYLFVHDIFIHRRKKIFKKPNNKYLKGILFAHRIHHSKSTKHGCEYFGMLFVPKVIFRLMKNG